MVTKYYSLSCTGDYEIPCKNHLQRFLVTLKHIFDDKISCLTLEDTTYKSKILYRLRYLK